MYFCIFTLASWKDSGLSTLKHTSELCVQCDTARRESASLNPSVADLMVLLVIISWKKKKCFLVLHSFLLASIQLSLLSSHSSNFCCAGSNRRHIMKEQSVFAVWLSGLLCHHTLPNCAWNVLHACETFCQPLFTKWISRYSFDCKSSKLPFRSHKLDLGYFDSMNLDSWKTFTFSCCLAVWNKQNTPLFSLSMPFNKVHKDSL